MARKKKAPRSTDIFDQLAQSRKDHEEHLRVHERFRMARPQFWISHEAMAAQQPPPRISPGGTGYVMHHSVNAPEPKTISGREDAWIQEVMFGRPRAVTPGPTMEEMLRYVTPRMRGYASRVPEAFTTSATSSGQIVLGSFPEDAAAAARPRLRQRSPRSGDPLKHWTKMMTEQATPSPTSTDSPDERP